MNARYTVRRARRSDAESLSALYGEAFPGDGDPGYWDRQLQDGQTLLFVARTADGAAVGFAHARRVIDEAEVLAIAVTTSNRRHGIARCLLEQLIADLRASPPCRLFLEVSVENAAAIALYLQSGFREAGFRKGYYDVPGRPPVDALLLVLEVGA